MNKILIVGDRGYLGSYLARNMHSNIAKFDNRKLINDKNEYDYVINCVGKANLEYCEAFPESTYYSNCGIINDIKTYYPDSKIINFSSYYVYDSPNLCDENSSVTDEYNYTRQNLECENSLVNGVSFRLGKLFGGDLKSQNKLTEHIINSDELFLDDVLFNPTSLKQVLDVINHELANKNLNGVYNLANKGIATHYEYGVFINEVLGSKKQINKIEKLLRFKNYGNFAMSCEKLNQSISLTDWKIEMKSYLNTL
jgi:dTDP-4-dehydrorhamnose reductase